MVQFALAERLGVFDVDSLADSLTDEQWRDWLVYGVANGWFRHLVVPKQKKTMDEMKSDIAAIYGTRNNSIAKLPGLS